MISCTKCAKDNQDHYKFCLGCGAELPRDAAPKKFSGGGTPPQGMAAVPANKPVGAMRDPFAIADEATTQGAGPMASAPAAAAPAVSPPAQAYAAPEATTCPQCQAPTTPGNKFCLTCGFKIGGSVSAAPPAMPAAAAVAPVAPAPAVSSGIVLTALRADGTESGKYDLPAGTTTIGRDSGGVFQGDSYLSPRHATFTQRGDKLFIRDEGSLNGVYRKLHREETVPLEIGDVFRIGQELLRLEALKPMAPSPDGVQRLGSPAKGYVGRIALIIGRDATGNAYPIPETGLHLGRERGDVLFPEDGYVSGLHCRINYDGGAYSLTDLGSSNGSFIRLLNEVEVKPGDIVLMGQQLFRIGA